MKSVAFRVVPEETLFFGPPASLPAGESHHGKTLFPPPSSAWQGMIRTRLLATSGQDLQLRSEAAKANRAGMVGGADELPGGWSIEGPIPAETLQDGRAQGWFSTPLWTHRLKDDIWSDEPPRPFRAGPLPLAEDAEFKSDLDSALVPIGVPMAGRTVPLGGWLDATDLLAVLRGGLPRQLSREAWEQRKSHWDLPPFVHWETRPGLALDGTTGTAAEGMLYFLKTLRFGPDTGLAGWFSGEPPAPIAPDALHTGTLTLGRKACPVRFGPLSDVHPDWQTLRDGSYLPSRIPQDPFDFWLYLGTSAYLENPVQPSLHLLDGEIQLEVRSALLHRPLWLGGFSLERRQARSNLPHVPAGSGWLVRLKGGTPESRANALRDLHSFSPLVTPARAAFGEGQAFVGLLSPQ